MSTAAFDWVAQFRRAEAAGIRTPTTDGTALYVGNFSGQYVFGLRLKGCVQHGAFVASNPLDAHAKAWAWAATEQERVDDEEAGYLQAEADHREEADDQTRREWAAEDRYDFQKEGC